ncbi:MBL fold metallo-hydrolase [Rhodococcus sp. UNC363MFTsu5.1]|uniref:MBL fold metallo-hydrolase n=1 Tax=Rhodococcus sp. UNC363MFTsu5.1 TaxID=1449069 RepID=UPI00048128E1|nr:MBL fold metallo-hydrolase [Rhodococcus sp. UNC363MFTsu5.1]
MRLRLGRPDINRYADRFDLTPATDGLTVTFLGVASLLVDDGSSAIMTDGFFSRPGLARVALGRIAPDATRIDAALARAAVTRLEAVIPVHTHFDHALDSPAVAERTGARLVGGESTAWIGRGHGLPADRIAVATPGAAMALGAFEVTMIESHHCPPDRYPGQIIAPVVPPVKTSAYRCGEAWSIIVGHPSSGRSLLVQGSAGYVPGALAGRRADVAYLGVGQLGVQPDAYIEEYWRETVREVGARRAVLIHWDDFFRPLSRPLRALPYAGDDLDRTMAVLTRLADEDGVALSFPTVFARENPWA